MPNLEEQIAEWLRQAKCPSDILPERADDLKLLYGSSKEARQVFELLVRRGVSGRRAQGHRAVREFDRATDDARSTSTDDDHSREYLLTRRRELAKDLAVLRQTESNLVAECKRILSEVDKGAVAYRARRETTAERREGLMMLRMYRGKLELQNGIFREYARMLLKGVDQGMQQAAGDSAGGEKDSSVIMSVCEGIVGKECVLWTEGLDQATSDSLSRQVWKNKLVDAYDGVPLALFLSGILLLEAGLCAISPCALQAQFHMKPMTTRTC
jgi:hypothetical protein